jgi:hypothetical protein
VAVSLKATGAWTPALTTSLTNTAFAGGEMAGASPVAGDRFYVWAVWKNQAATVDPPTGWTEIVEYKDGSVASGNGTGSVTSSVNYRDWQSGDATQPTWTWSPSAPGVGAMCWQLWQKDAGETWDTPTSATGNWTSSASQTINASSTITVSDGCVAMCCLGIADDSATMTRFSTSIGSTPSGATTWAGNYVESPATHFTTTTGNDMAADLGHRFNATGGSGITLTTSATLSAVETGTFVIVLQDATAGGGGASSLAPPVRRPAYGSLLQL